MAIPLPKLAIFTHLASDGKQMYNASAFAALDNCSSAIYMILTAASGEAMVIWLSHDDLRKLIELTEQ